MIKVGHQGVKGAFSYITTKQLYPDAEILSFNTFFDVLQAVEDGKIEYGIIPMENSYAGRVADVYNIFKKTKLFIVGEKLTKIEHNLAGIQNSKIEDITHIFSHEQALRQCENTLKKITPNAKLIAKENTAVSAQYIAKENNNHYGAICSLEAIQENNLKILKSNVQDMKNNCTLFIVFAKKPIDIDINIQNVLTSMMFEIKNKPGSLYKSIGCFAKNNIDLIKIESYIPNAFDSDNAMFFITTNGNIKDERHKKALQELKFYTNDIHIFGSYLKNRNV